MSHRVSIGIIGDFDGEKRSHWATEAALFHAAARLDLALETHWVETPALDTADVATTLARFDGLWGAAGSPFASFRGMLRGIEFARVRDVPYLGTCAGFQYALIEFTRSVLGLADADSAENGNHSKNVVITPVECPLPNRAPGSPRLGGGDAVRPVAGTIVERLAGSSPLREEYICNFETNREYVPRWEAAGLRIAALGPRNEMRALELPGKRFFLATLFQPQLSSSFDQPHPLITGYLRACART